MQQARFQNSAKLNDNIKVGTHDATSPCDWSLQLVASCVLTLRWLNRVMEDHEAHANDLNPKLIFSFFLLFS